MSIKDTFSTPEAVIRKSISVQQVATAPQLRVKLSQENPSVGGDRQIYQKEVNRPQFALAGFTDFFHHKRVQLFGFSELSYLSSLPMAKRQAVFRRIVDFEIPCIITTNGMSLEPELLAIASEQGVGVFSTASDTSETFYALGEFLAVCFAPHATIHGSFVDVYGVGMLITGKSGIGKSEIALELVERGHRLVADDVVLVRRRGDDVVLGTGLGKTRHFMEIRGLGIIDVRHMFGVRSIRFHKRLEIIVRLEDWNGDNEEYTRTGLEREKLLLLDVPIHFLRLPIFPGKNVAVIAEAVALDYLSSLYGHNSATILQDIVREQIALKTNRSAKSLTSADTLFDEDDFSFFNDTD